MRILYHYCSTSSFRRIVETKSIRLSSLTLSNDYMEGKLVDSAVMRLARADRLAETKLSQLKEALSNLESLMDGLGFCLSANGDLLSQWRGYADDGHGFSIGFSQQSLEEMGKSQPEGKAGFTIHEVKYTPAEHEAQVKPTYEEIRNLLNDAPLTGPLYSGLFALGMKQMGSKEENARKTALLLHVLSLLPKRYTLKAHAFHEEQEWRLVSPLHNDDYVANAQSDCDYFERRDRLVPFRKFSLLPEHRPIARVILGPRNRTPLRVVASMMKMAGFTDVEVLVSEATYQ